MARPLSPTGARNAFMTARVPQTTKLAIDMLSKYHGLSASQLLEKAIHSMWNSPDWEIKWKDPNVHTEPYDYGYDVIREVATCEPWLRSLKLSLMAPVCIAAPEQRFWKSVIAEGRYFSTPDLNVISIEDQLRYRPLLATLGRPDEKALKQRYDDYLKKEEQKVMSE